MKSIKCILVTIIMQSLVISDIPKSVHAAGVEMSKDELVKRTKELIAICTERFTSDRDNKYPVWSDLRDNYIKRINDIVLAKGVSINSNEIFCKHADLLLNYGFLGYYNYDIKVFEKDEIINLNSVPELKNLLQMYHKYLDSVLQDNNEKMVHVEKYQQQIRTYEIIAEQRNIDFETQTNSSIKYMKSYIDSYKEDALLKNQTTLYDFSVFIYKTINEAYKQAIIVNTNNREILVKYGYNGFFLHDSIIAHSVNKDSELSLVKCWELFLPDPLYSPLIDTNLIRSKNVVLNLNPLLDIINDYTKIIKYLQLQGVVFPDNSEINIIESFCLHGNLIKKHNFTGVFKEDSTREISGHGITDEIKKELEEYQKYINDLQKEEDKKNNLLYQYTYKKIILEIGYYNIANFNIEHCADGILREKKMTGIFDIDKQIIDNIKAEESRQRKADEKRQKKGEVQTETINSDNIFSRYFRLVYDIYKFVDRDNLRSIFILHIDLKKSFCHYNEILRGNGFIGKFKTDLKLFQAYEKNKNIPTHLLRLQRYKKYLESLFVQYPKVQDDNKKTEVQDDNKKTEEETEKYTEEDTDDSVEVQDDNKKTEVQKIEDTTDDQLDPKNYIIEYTIKNIMETFMVYKKIDQIIQDCRNTLFDNKFTGKWILDMSIMSTLRSTKERLGKITDDYITFLNHGSRNNDYNNKIIENEYGDLFEIPYMDITYRNQVMYAIPEPNLSTISIFCEYTTKLKANGLNGSLSHDLNFISRYDGIDVHPLFLRDYKDFLGNIDPESQVSENILIDYTVFVYVNTVRQQ